MINVIEKNVTELSQKQKIGLVILLNRKQSKTTQEELAKIVGCDQSFISQIESGSELIDNNLYHLALSIYSYDYCDSVEINQELKRCIIEVMDASIKLDLQKIKTTIEYMHTFKGKNAYVMYHLKVVEFVYHYLEREHDGLESKIDGLYPMINILLPCYKLLFFIMRLNLSLYQSNFDLAKTIIDHVLANFVIDNKGYITFFNYYIGWYYFKRNNRSMALHYFLPVNEYLKETNNIIRHVRVELVLANMLVREKNFVLALRKYQTILTLYSDDIRKRELYHVYFSLGYTYYLMNQHQKAIEYFNLSLEVSSEENVNHVYYYLLNIYNDNDDLINYRRVFGSINYSDQTSFGSKMISIYLQSKIGKTVKYYRYIELEIVPLINEHYQKVEIYSFLIELLDYYYNNGYYQRYHALSTKIFTFFQ